MIRLWPRTLAGRFLPQSFETASNQTSAYPIEYIENAKIPCISTNHPTNIILLTCDARGVLPPISKLTPEQTMFHFISGYTSKMAGTEDGVTEPQATFSACFAQPFLALHPMRYAKMLAEKISQHKANAWLLNTGWVGAGASTGGKRCPWVISVSPPPPSNAIDLPVCQTKIHPSHPRRYSLRRISKSRLRSLRHVQPLRPNVVSRGTKLSPQPKKIMDGQSGLPRRSY